MRRYSLETIIIILLILWVIGAFSPFAFGGSLIHLLLAVVLIVVLLRVLEGRRPLL